MAISVFLSPSNQDANLWCTGNTTEEAEAVKFADSISHVLAFYGIETVRADGIEPFKRYRYAGGCKCYIPLHTNAFNGETNGNRLFVLKKENPKFADSLLLASAIKARFDAIGHERKSVIYQDFARWNELVNAASIDLPCVYSETIFHDCRKDVKFYRDNYDKIVNAYALAIAQFCGVDTDEKQPDESRTFYRVIAGAFRDKANAEKRLASIKEIEPNAYIQTVKKEY